MSAIEYWYEHSNSVVRTDVLELLNMKINPITREPKTFKEECINTARRLYDEDNDVHIALSGGNESHVCLSSFIAAGIKPKVFILQFPKDLNSFDSDVALETCKHLGITPLLVKLDYDFNVARAAELSIKYQTYSFAQAMFAHYAGKVNSTLVIADKIKLVRDVHAKSKWCFTRSEDANMWPLRYNEQNKNKIVSNFFTDSPEQILSFLRIPVVEQIMNNPYSGKISLNSVKKKVYTEGGFEQFGFYNRTQTTDQLAGLSARAHEIIDSELKFRPRNMYIEYKKLVGALTSGGVTCQYI
jgi:hypothetical protein